MDDSVKNIRGVNPNPAQGGRMPLRKSEVAGSRTEVIRPSKYPNGENREGTPAGMEHRDARSRHYAHPEAAAHRERERSQPYPSKR